MIVLILNNKEAELIKKIYNQYSKFMFAVAYDILHNIHNTEDAVQQALIRIIDNIDKIGEVEDKKTRNYIGLIVKNIAINMYNSGKKQPISIEDDNVDLGEDFELSAIIIRKETEKRLKRYISELDDIYKIPILMVADGYDYNTIAKVLNITQDTARKRVERGRKKLRKAFFKEEN